VTPSRVAYVTILAKDLRAELRTLQSLPAMALFATTTFVIFRFGLDRTQLSGSLAAGVLWATLLFAALLGVNRLFVAEREEGGFDAIRLAPIDRSVLFGAKAAALVIYLLALELVAVPIFALFFLGSAAALGPRSAWWRYAWPFLQLLRKTSISGRARPSSSPQIARSAINRRKAWRRPAGCSGSIASCASTIRPARNRRRPSRAI